MDYSKFNGIPAVELRLSWDSGSTSMEVSRPSRLVLQLADRVLNTGTSLVQGARQGRWSSLQEALVKNPNLLRSFREKFSQAALLGLYTLESESVAGFFAPHLMAWVQNHIEPANLTLALSFYESWSKEPAVGLADLAQWRLDLIQNRRGWLETAAYRVGKAGGAFGDPVMLAGFALGGAAHSAVRAFILPRILATGAAAPVVNFLATGTATVPEALAFGGFMNLGHQFFYGQAGNWSWGYFRNLVTAFLTFKVTGAIATSASQWAEKARQASDLVLFGRAFLDFTKTVAPSLGTYSGIVLAHKAQEALAWKEVEVGANLWFDSALFFVELRAGGLLSQRIFYGVDALGEAWKRRIPEPMKVQGIFSSTLKDDAVAVTSAGVAAAIPDSKPAETMTAQRLLGRDLGEKRAWILKSRENLHADPEKREVLWKIFLSKLTPRESKVFEALLKFEATNLLKDFHVEMGGDKATLSHCIKSILAKLEVFSRDPESFLENPEKKILTESISFIPGSLSAKRDKVLKLREALDADPEKRAALWRVFRQGLTPQESELLEALLASGEARVFGDLPLKRKTTVSVLSIRFSDILGKLEVFSKNPQGFFEIPGNSPRVTVDLPTKRSRVLAARETLGPDRETAKKLWEDFVARLDWKIAQVMNLLIAHPEIQNAWELSELIGLSLSATNVRLDDMLFLLEKFSRDPESFIRKVCPVLPEYWRAKILELSKGLSEDSPERDRRWVEFKARLHPQAVEVVDALLEHPEFETERSLVDYLGISLNVFKRDIRDVVSQLENFSQDPEKFLRETPPVGQDRKLSFVERREQILEFRQNLSQDAALRDLLWKQFLEGLSPLEAKTLDRILVHPEATSVRDLAAKSSMPLSSLLHHLRGIFGKLEQFPTQQANQSLADDRGEAK